MIGFFYFFIMVYCVIAANDRSDYVFSKEQLVAVHRGKIVYYWSAKLTLSVLSPRFYLLSPSTESFCDARTIVVRCIPETNSMFLLIFHFN